MLSRHQCVTGRWLDFLSLCWVTGMLPITVFESCTPKSRCKQCTDLTQNSLGDFRVTVCFWWEMVVAGQSRCESSPRRQRQEKGDGEGRRKAEKQISSYRYILLAWLPLPLCTLLSPHNTQTYHRDSTVAAWLQSPVRQIICCFVFLPCPSLPQIQDHLICGKIKLEQFFNKHLLSAVH